jgi:prophage regulatory protein
MKPINSESGATTGINDMTTKDYMSPYDNGATRPFLEHIILRLPETGFMRLSQIIGNPKANPPIPPVIPICKTSWWQGVKSGKYPTPLKLGQNTTVWRVEDIRALIERIAEDPIQKERDETMATAIEQADGLLSGLGAGEATNASASIPTVSEPPIQPIKTRNSSYKHHLHLDRIRRENTRSPREHHLNELERIRRENEMAEE